MLVSITLRVYDIEEGGGGGAWELNLPLAVFHFVVCLRPGYVTRSVT
jgi:hypothetical protein